MITSLDRAIAEHLRQLGRKGHPAFGPGAYVIFDHKIASANKNWEWRAYGGSDPHVSHWHFSTGIPQISYDSTASFLDTFQQSPPKEEAKVQPKYDPPIVKLPTVADLDCPSGGAWELTENGSIYTVGSADYYGGAFGHSYFNGHHGAQLRRPTPEEVNNALLENPPRLLKYVILSREGGVFHFPNTAV